MIIINCLHHPQWVGVDMALPAMEQWASVLRHQSNEYLGMSKAACLFAHKFVPDPEPQPKEHWRIVESWRGSTPGIRYHRYVKDGPLSTSRILSSGNFSKHRKVD